MTTTALLSGSLADYEAGPATPSNSHTHTQTPAITISTNETNESPTPEIDRKSPIHPSRHLHHVSKPNTPPPPSRPSPHTLQGSLSLCRQHQSLTKPGAKAEDKEPKSDIKNDTSEALPSQLRTLVRLAPMLLLHSSRPGDA